MNPTGSPTFRANPYSPRIKKLCFASLRLAWIVIAVIVGAFYAIGVPLRFQDLQMRHEQVAGRTLQDLQLTDARADALEARGISLQLYSVVVVGSALMMGMPWLLSALLIVYWKPRDWRVIVFSLALLCFGAAEAEIANVLIYYEPRLEYLYRAIQAIGTVLTVVVFYLLPDFRFVPPKTKVLAAIFTTIVVVWWFVPQAPLNIIHATYGDYYQPWTTVHILAWGISGAIAMLMRYRRSTDSAQRRLIGVLATCFISALSVGTVRYVLQWIATTLSDPFEQTVWFVVTRQFYWFSLIAVPIGFFVAIRRHRIWGIDTYVNRALVYVLLTGTLSLLFGLIVGATNLALQSSLGSLTSPMTIVALTGLFVVIAQPLRDVIQRAVNRYMYGRRDDPYAMVARLGHRLADTLDSSSAISSIVHTIGQELKLSYVAIAIHQTGRFTTVAEFDATLSEDDATGRGQLIEFPIIYQSSQIAKLSLATRSPDESLSARDRDLLQNLARQAGPAVHAYRLTGDLRRSRERLVIAREDERRYIRRQLHDGLMPALASQVLKLDELQETIPIDPSIAGDKIQALKQDTRNLMSGVRELAYELRPPSLDELGLVAALQSGASNLSALTDFSNARMDSECLFPTISFDVPEPLPPLSAAVEAAAYRIAMEALTNVVRHAQACQCVVRLLVMHEGRVGRELHVCVEDDGVGYHPGWRSGVGTLAMRERAEELDGALTIESTSTGGARVEARLPIVALGEA
jgi:signal transduction histidine kinase